MIKVKDLTVIHALIGQVTSAELHIKEAGKEFKPGDGGNMPSSTRCYDQTGAIDIPGVGEARRKLADGITEAFREYRKDIIKLLKNYGIDKLEE